MQLIHQKIKILFEPQSHVVLLILFWMIFFLWLLPKHIYATQKDYAPLFLEVDEQRLLYYPQMVRYSIQSKSIRATIPPVKGSEKRILIRAIQPGKAALWVWNLDGSIIFQPLSISHSDARKRPSSLQLALSSLTDTEVISSGNGYLLRGDITSLEEAAKIRALALASPSEILDETTLSPELVQSAYRELDRYLKQSKYINQLRVEVIGGSIWIRGSLQNGTERKVIERELRKIFPKLELDFSSLPDHQPTISFKVFLIELRKSAFGSLGMNWPDQFSNAFKITPSGFGRGYNLDLAIQALEGKGSARILSRPELAVRAPGEAELFAGGELPIKMNSQYSSNLAWKPFGLSLKLNVSNVTSDRVRLDIQTEVSHLDEKISLNDVPGIQSSRLKTQVDAQFNVPLFLSGLLQEGMREQVKGLPWLRRLPILGLLFGSEDFLNDRSELVAILLPRIEVTPPPIRVGGHL